MLALVVSGDSDIDVGGGRVRVNESDGGDVDVRGLLKGLLVMEKEKKAEYGVRIGDVWKAKDRKR